MARYRFAYNITMKYRRLFKFVYEGTAFIDSECALLRYIERILFHKKNELFVL